MDGGKGTQDFVCCYHAIRLDLLSKVKGVDATEKYFISLPQSKKNKSGYGALLHCYCKENLKEKAMKLFKEMRELNFADTSLSYSNLMNLYMKVGESEKVPLLLREMKEKKIKPNFHSYNFLMNYYASVKDFEGLDGVLEEMKSAGVNCNSMTYTNLALIYMTASLFDKANSTLEKLEKMDHLFYRKAHNLLIDLHARASNKAGVKRVWESLKSKFSDTTNFSYIAMLKALSRLGETDELEKCFNEWESSSNYPYDIKVVCVLIDSYLSRDMLKEANLLLEDAVKKGSKPNVKTFDSFIKFYLKNHQMDLAFENFEGACSKSKLNTQWQPSEETISTFLKHFEQEKNVEGAERCYKCWKTVKCLNPEVFSSLLWTYTAAGLTDSGMRHRVEEDGIEVNDEIENLLENINLK